MSFGRVKKLSTPLIAGFAVMVFLIMPSEGISETEGKTLQGKRAAFLITEGFHDGETLFPMGYLQNRGAEITVIGPAAGAYTAYNSDAVVFVEKSLEEVSVDDFDVLVIPGGRSPDNLRQHEEVLSFARDFVNSGKPTAAVCHGPQVLVTAGVIEGRVVTGFPEIRDEIIEAGGNFVDEEVYQDDNLITSRVPEDLPAFSRAIEEVLTA